jgi:hypothetical protein
MGIGFVLIIFAVVFFFLGLPVSIGLAIWSQRNQRRSLNKAIKYKPLVAAILPYVLLAYGGVVFIVYGLWCESVRHVDAGIGDSWMVPIGNDYCFCMIDVPDKGYILKGSCSGSPRISDITEITLAANRIVGNSQSSGSFVFNTQSEKLQKFDNIDVALAQFNPRPKLKSAHTFYLTLRWGFADAMTLLMAGLPAIGIIILWHRRFIR